MIFSFWPSNYIREKSVTAIRKQRSRSLNITPRGRRDVNSDYQSPLEMLKIDTTAVTHLPCTGGCGPKATTGDGNGPEFRAAWFPMARHWNQNPDSSD